MRHALKAGVRDGILSKKNGAEQHRAALHLNHNMQHSFMEWCSSSLDMRPDYAHMMELSSAYVRGYSLGSGEKESFFPLLLHVSASAVVSASNEADRLDQVLNELERLPLQELIVVLNGCDDNSYSITRKHPQVTIVHYDERLGHDVGRSIGAGMARGDIILFTDGDIPIPAEQLAAFMYAVDGGCDVALNDINPFLPLFVHQDDVTRCKSFLNMALGRSDLGASSLTAVPHALSAGVLATIGKEALMIPPKAQALAITGGFHVAQVDTVNVFVSNRLRTGNMGQGNPVAHMIIGDHVEALQTVMGLIKDARSPVPLSRKDVAMRRNA
ncbi:hypothetical protein JCM16418A_35670 [Paenibacillus pini]